MRPDALVDITALDARARRDRRSMPDGLRLGALVRMAEAAEHPAVLPRLSGDRPIAAAGRQPAAAQHGHASAATCCSAPAAPTFATRAGRPATSAIPAAAARRSAASTASSRCWASASTASPTIPATSPSRWWRSGAKVDLRAATARRARIAVRGPAPPARRHAAHRDHARARRAHHRLPRPGRPVDAPLALSEDPRPRSPTSSPSPRPPSRSTWRTASVREAAHRPRRPGRQALAGARGEAALVGRTLDEATRAGGRRGGLRRRRHAWRQRLQARARPPHPGARPAAARGDGDLSCMADDARRASIGSPRRRIDGGAKVTGARAIPPTSRSPTRPTPSWSPARSPAAASRGFDLRRRARCRACSTSSPTRMSAARPSRRRRTAKAARPRRCRATASGTTARSSPSSSPTPSRPRARRRTRCGRDYEAEAPAATFDSPGVEDGSARARRCTRTSTSATPTRAFAAAPVKIDARYSTPTQHHNPIELFTTTCVWDDGRLTIYEPSQFVYGLKTALAKQLRIDPRARSAPSRASSAAPSARKGSDRRAPPGSPIAARRLGRPVKLVATRDQGFTIATYRAETRHHSSWARRATAGWCRFATRAGRSPRGRPLQRLRHRDDGADVRLPEHPDQGERRPCRPQHAGLHARAARHALHVRAGKRDGRAGPSR